jgi:hypothetical protein
MDKERWKKLAKKALEVSIGLLALGLAFVAGFLVHTRMPAVSFEKMPTRLNVDVAFSADGSAVVKTSDARAFTLAREGVTVLKDEKDAGLLKLSGLNRELHIFNDAFDVVLHLNGGSVVANDATSSANSNVVANSAITPNKKIVASSRGKKYYYADCPEVKQIKPENLVSFKSEAEAKAVGLTASQCILSKD